MARVYKNTEEIRDIINRYESLTEEQKSSLKLIHGDGRPRTIAETRQALNDFLQRSVIGYKLSIPEDRLLNVILTGILRIQNPTNSGTTYRLFDEGKKIMRLKTFKMNEIKSPFLLNVYRCVRLHNTPEEAKIKMILALTEIEKKSIQNEVSK